jgi:hypothetical protein
MATASTVLVPTPEGAVSVGHAISACKTTSSRSTTLHHNIWGKSGYNVSGLAPLSRIESGIIWFLQVCEPNTSIAPWSISVNEMCNSPSNSNVNSQFESLTSYLNSRYGSRAKARFLPAVYIQPSWADYARCEQFGSAIVTITPSGTTATSYSNLFFEDQYVNGSAVQGYSQTNSQNDVVAGNERRKYLCNLVNANGSRPAIATCTAHMQNRDGTSASLVAGRQNRFMAAVGVLYNSQGRRTILSGDFNYTPLDMTYFNQANPTDPITYFSYSNDVDMAQSSYGNTTTGWPGEKIDYTFVKTPFVSPIGRDGDVYLDTESDHGLLVGYIAPA